MIFSTNLFSTNLSSGGLSPARKRRALAQFDAVASSLAILGGRSYHADVLEVAPSSYLCTGGPTDPLHIGMRALAAW